MIHSMPLTLQKSFDTDIHILSNFKAPLGHCHLVKQLTCKDANKNGLQLLEVRAFGKLQLHLIPIAK